jgi:hypothetical protein
VRGLLASIALAALAASCGNPLKAGVCGAVEGAELEAALGGKPQAQSAATSSATPQTLCSWTAETSNGGIRMLALMVEKGSGKEHFETESQKLKQAYTRVGKLEGIGETALMGIGEDATAEHFAGEIVALKGTDVLSMRIEGQDPAAFEAVARAAAKAM